MWKGNQEKKKVCGYVKNYPCKLWASNFQWKKCCVHFIFTINYLTSKGHRHCWDCHSLSSKIWGNMILKMNARAWFLFVFFLSCSLGLNLFSPTAMENKALGGREKEKDWMRNWWSNRNIHLKVLDNCQNLWIVLRIWFKYYYNAKYMNIFSAGKYMNILNQRHC